MNRYRYGNLGTHKSLTFGSRLSRGLLLLGLQATGSNSCYAGQLDNPSIDIGKYVLKDRSSKIWKFADQDNKIVFTMQSNSGLTLLYPQTQASADTNPIVILSCFKNIPVFVAKESKSDRTFVYHIVRVSPKLEQFRKIETHHDGLELVKLAAGTCQLQQSVRDEISYLGQYDVNPKLIFAWNGFALEPIKQPVPTTKELDELSSSLIYEMDRWSSPEMNYKKAETLAPPRLLECVLQLYYSGHSGLARNLYDRCWRGSANDKKRYWNFVQSLLKQLKYSKEVQLLNQRKSSNG